MTGSLFAVTPLRLGGVPEHFNYPWHLAIARPDLADLALEWEDQFGGTGEMVAKLGAGELDLVSILTEGTVAAIDEGLDVTMVQVYVASPLQWGIFVPASSPIVDVVDLARSRIAISRFGSGSHLLAFVLADRDGWTVDQDQFVVVGGLEGAVAAFAAEEADLFLWDQYMTRRLVDDGRFRQLGVLETPWPSFVVAARNEVLLGRTSEVGRLVDAVVEEAQALHGRSSIVAELADRYELSHQAVEGWLGTTKYGPRQPFDPMIAQSVRSILADVNATG